MGFQSLIYSASGRLVASVEPTDFNTNTTHAQICRLIAAAPQMYDLLDAAALQMQDNLPKTAQTIRSFLASIDVPQTFELRTRGPR